MYCYFQFNSTTYEFSLLCPIPFYISSLSQWNYWFLTTTLCLLLYSNLQYFRITTPIGTKLLSGLRLLCFYFVSRIYPTILFSNTWITYFLCMIMLLITYTLRIIGFPLYLILEFTFSIISDLIVFIVYVKHIKVRLKK